MAQRLTDIIVKKLPAPPAGNKLHYDSEVKGFAARVTAAAAKSFVLNFRAAGIERRLTIGSFPDWSTTAARDRAKELKRLVDTGQDPMAERHRENAAPTVQDLVDRYVEEHGPGKRPRSLEEDASLVRQYVIPRLGKMRVESVRRSDVEALHREVSKATPVRANRLTALLSTLFNCAIAWELRTDNPAKGIARNRETRRERYLSAEEMQRLMKAIAEHPHQSSGNVVRLLALTGARKSEVLGAHWQEFDLTGATWAKPGTRTKSGRNHRVPLSRAAVELLRAMRSQSDSDVLFPGRRGVAVQTQLETYWRAIRRAADLQDVKLHDLRHSFASQLASGGHSLLMISQLLGHSQIATTQRYSHLYDDVQREAVEVVGALVQDAGGGVVVPIRAGRKSA